MVQSKARASLSSASEPGKVFAFSFFAIAEWLKQARSPSCSWDNPLASLKAFKRSGLNGKVRLPYKEQIPS